MADIFVVVPAYRDPQIVDTITRLRETATASLRFGAIVNDDDERVRKALLAMPDVDLFWHSADAARGVAFARTIGWSMWSGEPWGLSVDAHNGAEPGWDESCLAQQQWATKKSGRPAVLSASSAAEDWDGKREDRPRPGGFVFESGGDWGKRGVREGYHTTWATFPELDRPRPARLLSMAFSFFPGPLFDLRWPSWTGYWSEEPWFTLSAYEAGYSLWHPEGRLITTACWYQQKEHGAHRYREDRPVGVQWERRKQKWSNRAAEEYFASPRHDPYHAYAGAADGYPRNKDWWPE